MDSDDTSDQIVMWPEVWALDDQVVPTSPSATSSCSSEYSFRKDLLSDLDSKITSDPSLDRSCHSQNNLSLRETSSDFEIPLPRVVTSEINSESCGNDVVC